MPGTKIARILFHVCLSIKLNPRSELQTSKICACDVHNAIVHVSDHEDHGVPRTGHPVETGYNDFSMLVVRALWRTSEICKVLPKFWQVFRFFEYYSLTMIK